MRLYRLEISGFKSFPDRSELAFDHGVTAIVGPNGCGKSNVVDAITWVLGEQSAKSLRGDRMEDVIFSGSDARKPTGAAEVRLRFKNVTSVGARRADGGNGHPPNGHASGNGGGTGHGNGDGTGQMDLDEELIRPVARDVEISRRLYRSGESEYLIDGEICRLRDIQDLLMDAGLGTKAYAVIEQGKIGQILSARPTDRRILIEEAAGITKYKARRRSAELKLEAAEQNLARVEDIIFEVEKQRGALKRQAAKARRYRRLREDLRRWEKALFARKYRALAEAIDAARARLSEARSREIGRAAHLAEIEATIERLRIELAENEARATGDREAAHACELDIGRRQQQIEFDRQQVHSLTAASADTSAELTALLAKREPDLAELARRRELATSADREREDAAAMLAEEERAQAAAHGTLAGLEADVEAARNEVFAALSAAAALRHAVENAGAAADRLVEDLEKLDVEEADVRQELDRLGREREQAQRGLRAAEDALQGSRAERAVRESNLAAARIEREWRARDIRAREHDLAGLDARLASLEELQAARAGYGDAARAILAGTGEQVRHLGSMADHLEVDARYERAVEAWLGELLEHVVVAGQDQAAAGLHIVRERGIGRCGFVVLEGNGARRDTVPADEGLVALSSVITINGPNAETIAGAIGEAYIAESFERAASASHTVDAPIATLEGDVFRGPHIVQGGGRRETRGILATQRESKELGARIGLERSDLMRLGADIESRERRIVDLEAEIATLVVAQHEQEKAIVALQLQFSRPAEDAERLSRKRDVIGLERRAAEEGRTALQARQAEARESIARLEGEQRAAEAGFTDAQRRLVDARESTDDLARRVAEAKARHAALVERSAAQAADVARLEDAARELDERVATRTDDLGRVENRREALKAAIAGNADRLDRDVEAFAVLGERVRAAEERVGELRAEFDTQEGLARESRVALDETRSACGRIEIARATAEAELTHLAASCLEAVQATLDEVAAEVQQLDRDGLSPDRAAIVPDDEEEEADDRSVQAEAQPHIDAPAVAAPAPLTLEEAITSLRTKIDRLGPVNMMAIEQFDELESRYGFLTTQRNDLVAAIRSTADAIKRIDKTTRERFRRAFDAINEHFRETFTTLFGGGRAGLIMLDETDLLETGVDIIAQPPGKRLQNVQLLSGGEKAMTAMALMFAIFKYRPSPFCLLDEIDAPLDDANIGRFIEMLRGLQDETQFILITHNRKTMEIADRLYGVTMEEPGVSKLISVTLN
ncbi:MAG: chromosome segregation protein SMC [Acidobacteria bacterium]|nr:chromosome segregation protein SMC [Acidobacteriota bacterium]